MLACAGVRSASDTADDESTLDGSDGVAVHAGTVASDYAADYYGHYAADGVSYERNAFWLDFFARIADRLIEDLHPKTALDAGSAIGLLVEALRDRGVEADGVDFSEFAVNHSREDIRQFLRVGSITAPLVRHYDLITCLEVVEHMPSQDADRAIANLCAFTDEVILTSTPMHYRDPTHTNIHPQEYWTERFARQGFIRDVDYDGSYIAPWAARYRRSTGPDPSSGRRLRSRLLTDAPRAAGAQRAGRRPDARARGVAGTRGRARAHDGLERAQVGSTGHTDERRGRQGRPAGNLEAALAAEGDADGRSAQQAQAGILTGSPPGRAPPQP